MEIIWTYLKELLMRIPLISQNGYMNQQWEKYFSVGGFFVGLFLLILLYSANKDKKDHPIKGMIRVLMMVAVINSCSTFWYMICAANPNAEWYPTSARVFFQSENLFSGCLLTMALHTTYRGKIWAGAAFGLVTRVALVLMNYDWIDGIIAANAPVILVLILVQAVFAFFLSAVIAKRKTFTASWIWYLVYQVLPVALLFLIYAIGSGIEVYGDMLMGLREAWVDFGSNLPDLMPYITIAGAVLLVCVLLDVSVRAVSGRKKGI